MRLLEIHTLDTYKYFTEDSLILHLIHEHHEWKHQANVKAQRPWSWTFSGNFWIILVNDIIIYFAENTAL